MRGASLALALAVAGSGCTSAYRVRLADPAALEQAKARDATLPGLDLADRPVALRARAILEVKASEEDGFRPATVRDGRHVKRLGQTLILLGLGAGLAVAGAGAGTSSIEPGLLLGGGLAALGLAAGLPCIVAGAAAGSPLVD